MHPSVQEFVSEVLKAEHVSGVRVLEVGSYDVNGSVRPYIESLGPNEYLGVDAAEGPSVDRVVDCDHLLEEVGPGWDIVISTEMLEHVADWRTCVIQLADVLSSNGLLLITTRSPGFPYHPFPVDNWRFTLHDMACISDALGMQALSIVHDPQCPGVFLLARKISDQICQESLDLLTVAGVT